MDVLSLDVLKWGPAVRTKANNDSLFESQVANFYRSRRTVLPKNDVLEADILTRKSFAEIRPRNRRGKVKKSHSFRLLGQLVPGRSLRRSWRSGYQTNRDKSKSHRVGETDFLVFPLLQASVTFGSHHRIQSRRHKFSISTQTRGKTTIDGLQTSSADVKMISSVATTSYVCSVTEHQRSLDTENIYARQIRPFAKFIPSACSSTIDQSAFIYGALCSREAACAREQSVALAKFERKARGVKNERRSLVYKARLHMRFLLMRFMRLALPPADGSREASRRERKLSLIIWRHSSSQFMRTWRYFVSYFHCEKPVRGRMGQVLRANRVKNRMWKLQAFMTLTTRAMKPKF